MFERPLPRLVLACLLLATGAPGWAQKAGIYTCMDAQGRRLTSDRPIPECLDREQKELNPNGTVRRTLVPAMTAAERAAQQERERKAAENLQRQADERRMQKALLMRYPDQAAHDAQREKALRELAQVVAAGERRLQDLQQQRAQLATETEFYKDVSKWPPKLKRQLEETDQQIAGQRRFVAAQEEEKKRINTRLDGELARLKLLWAENGATATAGPVPEASKKQ